MKSARYDASVALASVLPANTPAEIILAQVEKMVASETFAQCKRLRALLRFVVREVIAGRGDEIKEYQLGIEVFGRTEAYDPVTDAIVRVEARRLRDKLKRYYETEGWRDELWIHVPKGTYVPILLKRQPPAPRADSAGQAPQLPSSAKTIAVLTFAALTSDKDTERFSDGLTEELIDAWSRIDGF